MQGLEVMVDVRDARANVYSRKPSIPLDWFFPLPHKCALQRVGAFAERERLYENPPETQCASTRASTLHLTQRGVHAPRASTSRLGRAAGQSGSLECFESGSIFGENANALQIRPKDLPPEKKRARTAWHALAKAGASSASTTAPH